MALSDAISAVSTEPPTMTITHTHNVSPTTYNHPSRNIFPFAIVFGALPLLSWLLPFIGHMGVCDSQGFTHDFAGSQYITKNRFMTGRVLRYYTIPIDQYGITAEQWDKAVQHADEHYSHEYHNLLLNNCHHHTAAALRQLPHPMFTNMTAWRAWWWVIVYGRWSSTMGMVQALLPFTVIVAACVLLGVFVT